MKKLSLIIFAWAVVLMLGLCAVSVEAQEYHYRYVSLDNVGLPPGYDPYFYAGAIDEGGRVYGTVGDEEFAPHVAIYANGAVTILQPMAFFDTVSNGIIAAELLIDPLNFILQAALFRGNQWELIPAPPNSFFSIILALTPSGTALVDSITEFGEAYSLYWAGQFTPLDFGPAISYPFVTGMNDQGIVSGTGNDPDSGNARGFRFNPRTGESTLLNPVSETHAWGVGINNSGDVLGYSFEFGGIERIGVWNRKGQFETYFVEGIPEFPTISNRLLFNDNNLIVITDVTSPLAERGNTYLVPKPGVRLNLADLVEKLPSPEQGVLQYIQDINNQGDMIGFSLTGNVFLLQRIGDGSQ